MKSFPSLEVLQDYLAFYRANWTEGKLRLCNEAPLKRRAGRLRVTQAGKWEAGAIAESCWETRGRREASAVLRQLIQALGYLELLCVNLFLSPWRREIKTLKTFTGNFVYYVKSILPESLVQQLLSEIGYVATTPTEYSLVRKLNKEEMEKTAFEIFLARIECENLLEIAGDMKDSDLADILQKRAQKHCLPCVGLDIDRERSQTKDMKDSGLADILQKKAQKHCLPCVGLDIDRERSQTKDMKDSGLADILQKRSQKHCLPCVGLDIDQERSQTKDMTTEESNGTPNPGMAYLSHNQSAFTEDKMKHGNNFGLQCITTEIQAVASKQTLEQDKNQNQAEDISTHSCIRSTDSEDFLIKYSDIVIGQKPLHLSTSSRATNEETWLTEARLGLSNCEVESLPHLPSDESGPQALAILNDSTTASKAPYDYQTQDSCQTMAEPKICDAMKHLSSHGSDTNDEPRELKGSVVQQLCESSLMLDKPKNKEDYTEKLMYPVEETARPESARSHRVSEERYHTEMKSTNLSCRDNYNMDLYSSDRFNNITGCRNPTLGPSYGTSVDVPILTRPIPIEAQYCGDIPADIRHRERCPLHPSLVDTHLVHMNEPSLESYVVINQDN